MNNVSKDDIKRVRGYFEALCEQASKELGFAITVGQGTYGDYGALTLKVSPVVEGEVMDKEAVAYDMHAPLLHLPKRGSKVTINGSTYKMVGFRPRAKMNVIGQLDDGRKFCFAHDVVAAIAARAAKA